MNYLAHTICSFLVLSVSFAFAADKASPAELLKLRASYEAELSRVTEPVNRKYLDALQKLQEFYTKNGDLDKALIVREEMQLAGQSNAVEKKLTIAAKDLEGSEWQWGTGGTLKLEKSGKAIHTAWPSPGVWKKVNNVTITLQRPGGDPPMTVVFSDQELSSATVTSHLGTTTTISRVLK